jgi:hypothetical protein
MTKLPPYIKSVRLPLFEQNIHFVTSMDHYNICLGVMGFPPQAPAAGKGGWYTDGDGDVMFLVGVMNGEHSTLVHEISHVTHFLCKYIGIDVEYGGANETFCYIMGALYKELAPLLDDANRKKARSASRKAKQ